MSKKNKKHLKKVDKDKQEYQLANKNKHAGFFTIFFQSYKKYPILYTLAVISTILSSIAVIIMPKLTNDFLNAGDLDINKIIPLVYILAGLQVGSGILMYIRNCTGGIIGVRIEIEFRKKVLEHLLKVDMSYFEKNKIGDILTKLISDTIVIGENMQAVPMTFLSSIVTFVGGMVVAFSINWQMSLIVLGVMFLISIISFVSVKVIKRLNYKWKKIYTEVNADVTDRISTITLIKSNATEEKEMKRILNQHEMYYQATRKTIFFDSFARALLVTLLTGINTIGLITGLIFASKNIIALPIIITFMMSVNTLIFPIIQAIQFITNWAKTVTSIVRINEILDVEPKITQVENPVAVKNITEDIIFQDVNFRYKKDSPWVLKNFTFTFEKGKSYAIVGATGAGKSTISKLLLRYYDPETGEILINNNNLKIINLKSYLDCVGYIEQSPQILYGTFIENIRYTKQNASLDEVKEAARKANLSEYIEELPKQYKTILGEKGMNLSGGQKQRIAIARIFLKNPELLILDEATSALDNIVEKEIQAQFNKLMVGRTSIVIAHRLSTIKNVDQILVLEKDNGLVQVGTFEELKVKEGHFKNLYQAGLMDK